MKQYIRDRLREKSTWAGLGALLAGFGIAIDPSLWEHVTALGVAVAGIGMAATPDKTPVRTENQANP